MYGDRVEFRALTRSIEAAKELPAKVRRMKGDLRDRESIRRACEDFTAESVIFDSSTFIDLAYTDPDGAITATNLDGPLHVLEVARAKGTVKPGF